MLGSASLQSIYWAVLDEAAIGHDVLYGDVCLYFLVAINLLFDRHPVSGCRHQVVPILLLELHLSLLQGIFLALLHDLEAVVPGASIPLHPLSPILLLLN